jgi:uncharacterized protein YbjT (DUF2867 family)
MKHVVVAGATGLVGRELVAKLAERDDCHVYALCRRAGGLTNLARVTEVEFDFNDQASYQRIGNEIPCNVFFCCLGTTIKKAGNPESFRQVDLDYPTRILDRLRSLHCWPKVVVISSVGADAPRGLYLRTKFDLEELIRRGGLPYLILRPSLLLGSRQESRPLEALAQALGRPLLRLARASGLHKVGALARILPIPAAQVARTMIHLSLDSEKVGLVVEGSALWQEFDSSNS